VSDDRTPREQAIVLMAQRRIRQLVRAQTGFTDEDLDALVDELGGDIAVSRAAAAIRRGDRSYAHPSAGQPQPAAGTTDVDEDEPGCPDDCGGCSCHVGNSAPCHHCVEDHDRTDVPTTDLPGGDTVPRKTEPVPVEPDVEDAITRGAAAAERSRTALATSVEARDAAADEDLAATLTGAVETIRDAVEDAKSRTRDDYSLTPPFPPGPPEVMAAVKLDRAAVEQVLRDIDVVTADTGPDPVAVLTVEQQARILALREVGDGFPDATIGEVLALADYIVTGTVPLGLAIGGGR
jgi:hypothetical protein